MTIHESGEYQVTNVDPLRRLLNAEFRPGTGQKTAVDFMRDIFEHCVPIKELFGFKTDTFDTCTLCGLKTSYNFV